MTMDMRVSELLSSRLCHDLVGPIGAINNGVELVTEFGEDVKGDALDLIGSSARNAARKLQFLRFAFGAAGIAGSDLMTEAQRLAGEYFVSSKISVEWKRSDKEPKMTPRLVKLMLNMLMLMAEALPRGGRLAAGVSIEGGKAVLQVEAHGEGAELKAELRAAIAAKSTDELDARSAQAYYTAKLAETGEGTLDVHTVAPGIARATATVAA
jgi:histidine phosphotransferase ChpT